MPRNQNSSGIIGSHTNAVANAPFEANVEMAGDTAENSTFAFSSFGINCKSFGNRLVWYRRFMYFCAGGCCRLLAASIVAFAGLETTNEDVSFTSNNNLVVPSSNLTFVTSPFCTDFKNVEYGTLFTAGAGGCRFACSLRIPNPLPTKNAADNTNFANLVFNTAPTALNTSVNTVFITTKNNATRLLVNSTSEKFLRRLVSNFSSSVSSEKEFNTSDGILFVSFSLLARSSSSSSSLSDDGDSFSLAFAPIPLTPPPRAEERETNPRVIFLPPVLSSLRKARNFDARGHFNTAFTAA
mmetsp:Transcript_1719/g.6199  ORF Transcript_1719/g.6199 Transcript_1719/m.6199 type:complete len:297 (+) Transcript_1719:1089-1979(+)